MALKQTMIALAALIASAKPLPAEPPQPIGAPPGTAATRYCMRVGPLTGNLAEIIECWTREEWAEQGVDVDREWAKEGVRTIG